MNCNRCGRYSPNLRRCLSGKSNPKTKERTKDVMSVMGTEYVCDRNQWKSRITQGG